MAPATAQATAPCAAVPTAPRFLFTWPIGRCSVMGPDQLSGVTRHGKPLDEAAPEKRTAKFREGVERDSTAYVTSANVLDDGIIDPWDMRDVP